MKRLKKLISDCFHNSVIRYIFFGGLTTLVNLVTFFVVVTLLHVNREIGNTVSVMAAILFAYFTNSRFVFDSGADSPRGRWGEFVKFVGARISTMVIEVGGVWFMAEFLAVGDMVAKLIIQFVVLVLNYVFSKFLVFTKKQR